MSQFPSPLDLGPLNGGVLFAMAILVGLSAGLVLRRLHHGESAPVVPLAVALILPLAFAAWASTFQHERAMAWATTVPEPLARQTWMAAMIARTIATQLYGGLLVSTAAAGTLIAANSLTVAGERPRWLPGALAAFLGVALIAFAAIGTSSQPPVVVGARLGLYAVAVAGAVIALVAAHRRGPGLQLATLAAVTLPVSVVGTDLATLGAIAGVHLRRVALADPADRLVLMERALAALDALQQSTWITLGLAAALALLGPAVVWRRERPMAGAMLFTLAAVVLVAGAGLGFSTSWTAAFR